MIIRNGRLSDIEAILALGKESCDANPLVGKIGMKREAVVNLLSLVETSDNVVGLVLEVNGNVEGMFYAMAFPHPFNTDYLIADLITWWVRPEFRKGAANMFLDEAEKRFKQLGVSSFILRYFPEHKVLGRYLNRRGYEISEILTIKEF